MHILKYWPLALTTGSFKVRLCIWIGTFPICLGLYALFFAATRNGMIAVIPILAGSWLFKYRGMLISIVFTTVVIYLLNYIFFAASFAGNSNLFGAFIGTIFGVTVGSVTCLLRQAFDTVVASRQKVMQAEHEKMLAYESKREAQEAGRRIALAYEQQQQLNQQKDLFLAHVNHELCTPLVTVSGYLELLLIYHERLDEDKQLFYMRKALEGAQELNALVANLLDAAQFTAAKMAPSYEEISLAQVAREVLAQWNPRDLQDFTFSMEIHDTMMAWADRRFLVHILRNLLSNACKYAPGQTTVHIRAIYNVLDESPEVCLSVKDEGKGIPPDQIALLFEKFVRLPQDMTGPVRGTGLGYCRRRKLFLCGFACYRPICIWIAQKIIMQCIKHIRCFPYRIPFRTDFTTAHGTLTAREGVIVEIVTNDDLTGIGEIAPMPEFAGDDLPTALAPLPLLSSQLIGRSLFDALDFLYTDGSGLPATLLCGLESALLDGIGKFMGWEVMEVMGRMGVVNAARTVGVIISGHGCERRATGIHGRE